MNKEFYIDDDGVRLHAKLDMPVNYKDGDKCPLVIVIHGLTGHMEERHITAVSGLFNSLGAASMRVEMYGHGKSGGDFERHNILKWLNNGMTLINYAKQLDFVNGMYVCGHSMGGLTALLLAGMEPDVLRAAILLSPGTILPYWAREGHMFGESFDPCAISDIFYVNDTQKVSGDYIRAAQLIDEDNAIKRFNNPVLIVHADMDEAIPVSYSYDLAGKYRNARFVMIKGDDHCYDHHLDQVLEAVSQFMREQLG
ncbi:MAG: alpha/beta fold hydrolase [Eubacterium sp.]|nr:alpha/beta fold hydrolase [Eubacterium sp.]